MKFLCERGSRLGQPCFYEATRFFIRRVGSILIWPGVATCGRHIVDNRSLASNTSHLTGPKYREVTKNEYVVWGVMES